MGIGKVAEVNISVRLLTTTCRLTAIRQLTAIDGQNRHQPTKDGLNGELTSRQEVAVIGEAHATLRRTPDSSRRWGELGPDELHDIVRKVGMSA